jgi:hypothetical protein
MTRLNNRFAASRGDIVERSGGCPDDVDVVLDVAATFDPTGSRSMTVENSNPKTTSVRQAAPSTVIVCALNQFIVLRNSERPHCRQKRDPG